VCNAYPILDDAVACAQQHTKSGSSVTQADFTKWVSALVPAKTAPLAKQNQEQASLKTGAVEPPLSICVWSGIFGSCPEETSTTRYVIETMDLPQFPVTSRSVINTTGLFSLTWEEVTTSVAKACHIPVTFSLPATHQSVILVNFPEVHGVTACLGGLKRALRQRPNVLPRPRCIMWTKAVTRAEACTRPILHKGESQLKIRDLTQPSKVLLALGNKLKQDNWNVLGR
jgi:hypothetical protein